MHLFVFASFEVRPLQPYFDYWLERLGWGCTIEILPAYQLFHQLLSAPPSEMDLVLARAEDLGVGGQDELERVLQARSNPCIAYVSGGRNPHPVKGTRWLDPAVLSLYAPIESDGVGSELPFREEAYAALATALLRTLTPRLVKPLKLLVVDADNTLWDGVVAEDGLSGLRIGPERRQFQTFLKARVEEGYLLAVCSKNARADVETVFRDHPEMVLRDDQVLAWLVGWTPKSSQILTLLEELKLGLESVLVFDDNALEIAELRAASLQAVHLPEPAGLPGLLEHLWWFAEQDVTLEDALRTNAYRQELERTQARRQSPDLAQFLATLQLEIQIHPLRDEDRSRASQLTYRTNQFHLAPRGRAESEFREALGVWVSDRFGDYGLVGLMDFQALTQELLVETFLLSCRSLGRGVEQAMLRHLGALAGSRVVKLRFLSTERNLPAAQFLQQALGRPLNDGWNELEAARACQLKWEPQISEPKAGLNLTLAGACPEFCLVAEQQWLAKDILAAIRPHARSPRPNLETPFAQPGEGRQLEVAEVWAEVLAIEPVGLYDGFFELGGDSLAMLRVLTRLQECWGKAPSLDHFLRNPTVLGLSQVQANPEPLALEWVNELSDQEVEALLSQLEQTASIEAVAIPTAGRPHGVARAVASFHQHLRARGRPTKIVVSDQSSPDQCRETQQFLEQLARSQQIDLHYLGAAEQAGMRQQLVEKGFDPEVVTFTLGGGELQGCGTNRNLLLMALNGSRFLSIDDDTLATPLIYGDLEAPARFCTGAVAEDVFFFREPGRETPDSLDLLSLHERLLGRLRVEIGEGSPGFPLSLPSDAWVAATFNGLYGDSGLGAPFGFWEEPLGLLALNDLSQADLLQSESHYRAALLSRRHLRLAPVPVLSDGFSSLSTFVSLDTTRFFPPWWPVMRGCDRLFPLLVSAAHPGALFGHLPVAAPHEPLTERRFSPGELFRNTGGIDISRLMVEAVRLWKGCSHTHAAERLRSLGTHLEELARNDFAAQLLTELRRRNESFVGLLLERKGPAFFREDLEGYCRRLLDAQQRSDYWIPVDLRAQVGARAAEQTGQLLGLFGRMLQVWPDLLEATQEMARTRPFGQPLQPARQ